MTLQYLPVLLVVIGASGFMAVMLLLNSWLGPKPRHAPVMDTPFECGSPRELSYTKRK